jgi:hypothetical protein
LTILHHYSLAHHCLNIFLLLGVGWKLVTLDARLIKASISILYIFYRPMFLLVLYLFSRMKHL